MIYKIIGTCQEITEKIELQQMRSLNIFSQMQLNLHLSMCKACLLYKKQSLQIQTLLKSNWQKNIPIATTQMDEIKIELKKIWKN